MDCYWGGQYPILRYAHQAENQRMLWMLGPAGAGWPVCVPTQCLCKADVHLLRWTTLRNTYIYIYVCIYVHKAHDTHTYIYTYIYIYVYMCIRHMTHI